MTFLFWLFSKKHYEIKIVLATLTVLIVLPVVSVVVLASSGFAIIGSVFASPNPQTKTVEIYDPNGRSVRVLQLSTNWPAKGYISDEFGTHGDFRKHMGLGPHTGIDIANEFGIPGGKITPFMPGKVVEVEYHDVGLCGIHVRVSHDNNIESLYCHMSVALATEQQDVVPGDVIGLVGETGAATGPHVHFQINVYGIATNPRNFMIGTPERNLRGILP